MSGEVSARTAEVAWIALRKVVQLAAPRRNGRPLPADIVTAFQELEAARSRTRTEVGAPANAVAAYEQIDVREAARRLRCSVRAVQKRCATGRLPATRIGHRTWLIEWRNQPDG
jgi:excisionase family DNA binding protein